MWWRRSALALMVAAVGGCYLSHERPGALRDVPDGDDAPGAASDGPSIDTDRASTILAERPVIERPVLPPVLCDVEPTEDCVDAFPRIMIVMDASSSMLAGREAGDNNWDKARLALAGNPDAPEPDDAGYVQPAFARELEVRGNVVTMEDVFHLGMVAFNDVREQRLMLQYTPCASDNLRWAMDPYVSCEAPGCYDPYGPTPEWSFKNSDVDRDPPFVETTYSYMPPCNEGGPEPCVGGSYNTFTGEGLAFARDNIAAYRRDPGGFAVDDGTRFANILITDGDTSPGSDPETVLRRMRDEGVPTYVIGLQGRGFGGDLESTLEVLDGYARAGGTRLATLIAANESDIAEAFAQMVTRIIDEVGTDPCCQPTDCSVTPEPPAP